MRSASVALGAVVLAAIAVLLALPATGHAAELPERFEEEVALSGLVQPTAVRFAPDGRVFVAEQSGLIKVFSDLDDPAPAEFADLRTEVHNFWDRGLLGLALDPDFPAEPYVYALYTYDLDPAHPDDFPRWGTPGAVGDGCPTPPGATDDGCVVSGRLSRLEAQGDQWSGTEEVLVEDWCQQFPSHSIGSLVFGSDGALYASAGDGASFGFADYGQSGDPPNPCDDPPTGAGGSQTPPSAEGGALRSQDLRTTDDPTGLNGSIIRVDPETGDPLPDNPGGGDANARRIVAHGFRNPFRFTRRPGSDELWVGDVGWSSWEEINRITDPAAGPVENFGWPCYEGPGRQGGYDGLDLTLCEDLYDEGSASSPHYAYGRNESPGAGCPTGGSVVSGIAFYEGGIYPPDYDGALFFADHSRRCIWAMVEGAGGDPDPADIHTFVADAANPVDLQIGPGGDLFYVDLNGGTVRRVTYDPENQVPTAVATASATSGPAPLEVDFDGTESSDPDGESLEYAWDLDGDGQFDDSTAPQPSFTYDVGTHEARLRVTDPEDASDTTDPIAISAGNTPPTVEIDAPAAETTWAAGDTVDFEGSATDAQDGDLSPSDLEWSLALEHCPSSCHTHSLDLTEDGDGGGSFVAPDHGYPSHLELRVSATDGGGLSDTATVRLDPETIELTLEGDPVGDVPLTLNGEAAPGPLTREVIVGSTNSVAAPPTIDGSPAHWFRSWSDGGERDHDVVAPPEATTLTAGYRALPRSCRLDSPRIVVGTGSGERLAGTRGEDAIVGRGGADVALGRGGDDCLIGHRRGDVLRGRHGDDRLLGGVGADRLHGGPGRDTLHGGRGPDVLRGGRGRDVVRCGPGFDRVIVRGPDRVARDCERVIPR